MPEFTSYAAGTPCWVDVTSPELDRTISFYSDLFGWHADQDPRPEAGGYTMFSKHGKSVCAASPPQGDGMPSYWTTYLASDDVDATAARVGEAGGTLLAEPFDVFDAGRMAVAQDPAGATFGIWQAGAHHGAELANEPGTLAWNENQTTDAAAATDFYAAVFGYGLDSMPLDGGPEYRLLKVVDKSVAGVMQITPEMEGLTPNWTTIFSVEDADAASKKTEALGGKVLAPPFDIPDIGRYAVLQDPIGAVFGVLADATT